MLRQSQYHQYHFSFGPCQTSSSLYSFIKSRSHTCSRVKSSLCISHKVVIRNLIKSLDRLLPQNLLKPTSRAMTISLLLNKSLIWWQPSRLLSSTNLQHVIISKASFPKHQISNNRSFFWQMRQGLFNLQIFQIIQLFTSELTMLFWLIFPYEKCIELRQVIAVSTSHTFDPISCQFKGYFLSAMNSAIVSPAKNSSIRQRNSVSQKKPKHLTIKLWLISMFFMQNFIYSQSYFYLERAAFLYPFITKTDWVFLCRATIQRYYSYSLRVLRILKSSIVGVFWLFLFFKKDGAILHFFSQGLAGFFACFLSKKLVSAGVLAAFARSLLLFKGARYLRAKGRGLKVVRKLWTER